MINTDDQCDGGGNDIDDNDDNDDNMECNEEYEYIFGFGSIMNRNTHGENVFPGAAVIICKEFGYERKWNFRSSTGFTALGVSKVSSTGTAKDVNGVLFRVAQSLMPVFDRREVGYEKVRIPLDCVEFFDKSPSSWHKKLGPEDRLWVYVPLPTFNKPADENHPLLQSYVDTVLQGCLEWGGESMAESFIQTTGGWSTYFLNDTPSSRRPWLFRKDYSLIDRLLQKYASKTYFGDRKHPEEFSSAFHRRMKGTWSIPRRNKNFVAREKELKDLWSRFVTGGSVGSNNNDNVLSPSKQNQQEMVVKVEVAGMGGVGKSQLCTEYCYRHFPREYGLVVWLNAESAESLVADYRQLLMDLSPENASEVIIATNILKSNDDTTTTSSSTLSASSAASMSRSGSSSSLEQDTDEIVREVKTRLFRSQVPWLLVFDNLEDRKLLDTFVPRGSGTRGHILVTTRLFEMEWDIDESCGSLLLGCFSPCESVELLKRAAGANNMEGEANFRAAKKVCERMGHLPLALGMAAAYMLRCDVKCVEYLERYNESEKSGQSLLRHGKLQDYSLSVASSLSLSLVAIEKESKVACNMLHLLCFLGPEQITKPLLRHLLSTRNQLQLHTNEILSNREQNREKKRIFLGLSVLLSCGIGLTTITGNKSINHQRTRFFAMASLSTISALLVASYNGLVFCNEGATETKKIQKITRSTSSTTFSADEYEETDSVWNILKSYSLLIVKDGRGSMHRLLSQALRHSQTELEYRSNLKICLHAMQSMWTFKADETDTWKESLQVLDHLKSVVSHTESCDDCNDRLEAGRLSTEAGVYSAMALNAFIDAQQSFELSISLFENSKGSNNPALQKARAEALHELGRVFRYQGNYVESERSLTEALNIYEKFTSRDLNARKRVADTLHELGVLEVKKHNLDSATNFLELSLDMRQSMGNPELSAAHSAATLHQLAAIMVARKPPHLEKAKYLLQQALGLSRQIGQRAATLKQLARVTIREGSLDRAETYLEQALDLYMELYGENKNHINIAAVKFQQGALAHQREQWEQAYNHFFACLCIRRNVYAYARPVGKEDEENPTHLEISCVLHELACMAFAQGYFSQAVGTLKSERIILARLEETSDHHTEKIYQNRLTNLTWLRKCAKGMGEEEMATEYSNERSSLKQSILTNIKKVGVKEEGMNPFLNLQQASMSCRLAARKLVLEQDTNGSKLENLKFSLVYFSTELDASPDGPMKEGATKFRDEIMKWKDRPNNERKVPLLEACDMLR